MANEWTVAELVDLVSSHATTATLRSLYSADLAGARRRRNLERYFDAVATWQPAIALIGEAPGHRGSVLTGVPFVSQQQATDLSSPFRSLCDFEVELGDDLRSDEVTSNVMWSTLRSLQCRPLLWSACSRHPHVPGVTASNRTPTPAEVREHRAELTAVLAWSGATRVVAVGAVASRDLTALGVAHTRIRHPARGGARAFSRGLADVVAETRVEDLSHAR